VEENKHLTWRKIVSHNTTTMATATHFCLTANTLGNFDVDQKKDCEATKKAEQLLQENLDTIDMMFIEVRHSELIIMY
jgi:hypothetical protein